MTALTLAERMATCLREPESAKPNLEAVSMLTASFMAAACLAADPEVAERCMGLVGHLERQDWD